MKSHVSFVAPQPLWARLVSHLFQRDGGEHGAVIAAGVAQSDRGIRLLARKVYLAEEGRDYLPGRRGYRMLSADFVRDRVLETASDGLAYLAVHNHDAGDSVDFSSVDIQSHERGYPALLDLNRGLPVGGLVLATRAVAGDIWFPGGTRAPLAMTTVTGPSVRRLFPKPPLPDEAGAATFARQTLIFGAAGQRLLGSLKVGVVGAGGAGSLLVEYLSRLGVGHLVVADPDQVSLTNLSRVVGATRGDARAALTAPDRPRWLQRFGWRFASTKVAVARRVAKAANPSIQFEAIAGDFVDSSVAKRFTDCDFLFLAADSFQARLLFNAIVHQYLVPGIQVGAKVRAIADSGVLTDVYSVERPVTPAGGCLLCSGLIPPGRLSEEAATTDERRAQRYVDDSDVAAPSVITLNALSAAHAANDFLFAITGLRNPAPGPDPYLRVTPLTREVWFDQSRRDPECLHCGDTKRSLLARGDGASLPARPR